jgi:hypothetical protein
MAVYMFKFLEATGATAGAPERVECASDAAVLSEAVRRLERLRETDSIEVWADGCLLLRLGGRSFASRLQSMVG